MARDRGYGSGYKNTGKADPTVGKNGKRKASGAESSRAKSLASGASGRRAGASPFNNAKGRAIGWDEIAGVAAGAGLAAAGIAGARATRGGSPKRITSGARPMTTAERSSAVTRAGRNRVGKIGIGTKPERSYEHSYNRAGEIYEKRTGKYSPDNYVKGYEKGVDTKYTNFTESQQVYTNRAMLETVRSANKRKAKGGR